MRYWFKLSDKDRFVENYIEGRDTVPVKLYPETAEIVQDFENDPLSDWWGVVRYGQRDFADFTDFASRVDAEKEFAASLVLCNSISVISMLIFSI